MTPDEDRRTEKFDVDVPEADALEQQRAADDGGAPDDETPRGFEIAPDVPEADALEQAREAGLDDEEHG